MSQFKKPMLASEYDPNKLRFPLFVSPKIDGIRCVIDRAHETNLFDPYSRNGKVLPNKHVQENIGLTSLYGLDGEITVGDPAAPDVFNRTSSAIMAKEGRPDFTFWVFDLRCYPDMIYSSRMVELAKTLDLARSLCCGDDAYPHVKLLEQRLVFNQEQFDESEELYLSQGYEGMMVRDPNGKYKFGRSTPRDGALLKVKRVAQDEAKIIGFFEQMHNANEAFTDELGRTKRSTAKDGLVPAGTLGAFVCVNEEKWPGKTFNVGPGVLTAAQRKEIWDNLSKYVLRTLTFAHLLHGAKDRPRHGRFKGFRDEIDI